MEIKFADPNRMNLIGYFMRDILRNNLTSNTCLKRIAKLNGAVLFNASGMQATLIFQKNSIEIYLGAPDKINSKITGDLNTLLDIALGANYLKYILFGKIRISGNVFLLLKMMKILRVK